jgi:hypothetical protein
MKTRCWRSVKGLLHIGSHPLVSVARRRVVVVLGTGLINAKPGAREISICTITVWCGEDRQGAGLSGDFSAHDHLL